MKIGVRIEDFATSTNDHSGTNSVLPYTAIREIAQTAEEGGLDSIWHSDHLLYRFQPENTKGPWESWTILSALAEATSKIELGSLVLSNPFRNPGLLAKMAHTLDEVSNGRLILGIGTGWHKPEFDAFGYSFNNRVDRLEESLQILQPLLKGKKVDFNGTYNQANNCVITPVSPRSNGIPLLIGAHGPRMLRLTAQYADMWNKAWLGDAETFKPHLAELRKACEDTNRDMNTLDITASVSVSFPDLGKTTPFTFEPITGSIENIAREFQKYEELGTAHLVVQYTPSTLAGLERLIGVVKFFRKMKRNN